MTIEKIIILEADLILRNNLENYLRRCRYDVAATSTIAVAREYLSKDNFDMIFSELQLPDGHGADLLKEIQTRAQKPLVVITTSSGSIESAVTCIKNGAFDYLIKPFSDEQIGIILRKAEEFTQLVRVNRLLSQETEENEHVLLGTSLEMENLRQLIRKVARTHATVLIQGESGTGKEAVARALYRESPRARAPFIKVNCAATPESLIESEFFGHERGAFTGAINKREGRFELAHGGTILLDEISEISPTLQAKLLRVLQEREFERVGGNRTIKVDVRVIATTNRNLEQSVEKKIPAGPLLPAQRRADSCGALARALGRRAAAEKRIHAPLQPAARRSHQRLLERGAGNFDPPFVAGQCARTAKRHRTRRHFVRRQWNAGAGTPRRRHFQRSKFDSAVHEPSLGRAASARPAQRISDVGGNGEAAYF